MMDFAQGLFDYVRPNLATAGLVFLRISAVMAFMPAFGERVVPMRIRLALALAFTTVVAPAVADRLPESPDGVQGHVLILAAETLNGLALGFLLRLFVLAIEMAGTLAAQSGSLSQMFAGAGEPMPAIAHLLVMSALCLALLGGLHVRLVQALILSYDALPAGGFPAAAVMRDWSLGHLAAAFGLAFSLAAPFLIGALIYNVALGVINRAMPSLMVSFLGAPALTGGVLMLLGITVPLMLAIWMRGYAAFLSDPFTVAR